MTPPRNQKKIVLIFFSALLILGALTFFLVNQSMTQFQARETLDRNLGQAPPEEMPPNTGMIPPDQVDAQMNQMFDEMNTLMAQSTPFGGEGFTPPGHGVFQAFQTPQVRIDEERGAYVVHVPLQHPEDEKNVQVQVDAHRINVTGKTEIRSPDGQQVFGSSSFAKSLGVSAVLLPNQVSRTVENNMLVVTVPKKTPSDPAIPPTAIPQPGTAQRPQSGSPNLNQQLQRLPKNFI